MKDIQLRHDFEEAFAGNRSWIEELDGSSIFVTGATGLIGSIIGRAILYYNKHFSGNIKLICCIRNIEKAKKIYNEYLGMDNFEFCVCNIDNGINYTGKVDYIVHCANTTSSQAYVNEPVETIITIVDGTRNMLEFAREKNVKKFVYMSSMESYGAPFDISKKTVETDSGYLNPMCVRSSYSEGKRLAECLCASYYSEYGVKTVVARSAQVFGAGVNINDKRVFMQLAFAVINKTNFVMHSDGSSYGNYCYTTDALKAIMVLLYKGECGQAYNIVNEENTMTIRQMAEMVSSEISENGFKIIYDIPESELLYGYGQKVIMKLSSEKLNKLGWNATVPLKDMYRKLIEYLEANEERD